MNQTPLVIAHRGASAIAAEHSLEAYERAIDEGADGLECDVRMTLDGHLVCVHDRRIDRTSSGYGAVSSKTLRELVHHDFVTWASGPKLTARQATFAKLKTRVPVRIQDPELEMDLRRGTVLTLDRLLELVVDTQRPLLLAIETKHPNRYAGQVERAVVERVRHYGLHRTPRPDRHRVQIMSFSAQAVRRIRNLAPVLPTVFLMERVPIRMREGLLPFGSHIAGPGIDIIRAHPGYVDRVHRAGGQVHVWTVDQEADIDLCRRLGVDAIITNRPGPTRLHLSSSSVS